MFGQPKPFGSFGAQAGATTAFGTSGGFGTPGAGTGGGIFGGAAASTPAAAGTATGGGLFGNTSNVFGQQQQQQQQQQQSTGFNFGQSTSTASTGGGLFGGTGAATASAPGGVSAAPGGLFSTPATSTGFGAKTPGGFGGAQQTSTGGGLFGGTSTSGSTSLFGGTSTSTGGGGLFGGGAGTTFGGGAAAGQQQQQQQQGGTVFKFSAPTGTDTMLKGGSTSNINTRHQCITAMKEYENKSLEELRVEDYLANRKGPQAGGVTQAAGTGGGLFGAASATTTPATQGFGGFGQQQQQQQQQAQKPAFGGFGTASTASGGLFGSTPGQQTMSGGGGLFGANTQAKPAFGATTTTASTSGFGGFGAASSTGQTGGLFGSTAPKPPGLFGGTSQSSGGIFGTSQPATATTGFGGIGTNTGFGQTTQAGLFGQTQAKPAFGASTGGFGGFGGAASTSGGGLFGGTKPTTTTSGFGGFGAPASTGFGAPQQTGGGLFGGNKPAQTGFGTGSTLGGFGTSLGTTTGGGLFSGAQAKPLLGGGGTNFGTNFTGGLGGAATGTGFNLAGNTLAGGTLQQQPADGSAQPREIEMFISALKNSPYGDNPLFRNIKVDDARREELLKPTNPAAQRAALQASSQYKVSSRPVTKIKPKPLHSMTNLKTQLFDGFEEEDSGQFGGNETFVPRRSIKKLVIAKNGGSSSNGSLNSSQNSGLGGGGGGDRAGRRISSAEDSMMDPRSPMFNSTKFPDSTTGKLGEPDYVPPPMSSDSPASDRKSSSSDSLPVPPSSSSGPGSLNDTIAELSGRGGKMNVRHALEESRLESSLDETQQDINSDRSGSPLPPHPAGVVLNRPDYYTMPALDEIGDDCIDGDGNCFIDNLVIGREGYGNVMFPGETNLAGLNLDEIVFFRRKEITIYPDDENKPDVGEGLNKKAQVTLDCVWPSDKSSRVSIKSPTRLKELNYQDRLERASLKIGAKFVDYLPETGSWVFEVRHFSKYGLLEDSDNEDDIADLPEDLAAKQQALAAQKQKQQQTLEQQKKLLQQRQTQQQQQQQQEQRVSSSSSSSGSDAPRRRLDDPRQAMTQEEYEEGEAMDDEEDEEDIMAERFPESMEETEPLPSSHRLAIGLGLKAHDLQLKKASFFADEDEDYGEDNYGFKPSRSSKSTALDRSAMMDLTACVPSGLKAATPGRHQAEQAQQQEAWVDHSMFSTSFRGNRQSSSSVPAVASSTSSSRSPLVRPAFRQQQQQAHQHKPKVNQKKVEPVEHPVIPSGMPQDAGHRGRVAAGVSRGAPYPLSQSFFTGRENLLVDHALLTNRATRVGWAPNWKLGHVGKSLCEQDNKVSKQQQQQQQQTMLGTSMFSVMPQQEGGSGPVKDGGKPSGPSGGMTSVVLEQIHTQQEEEISLLERCLSVQLDHSSCSTEQTCPQFVPTPGINALHDYAKLMGREIPGSVESDVWSLCVALWGELPTLAGVEDNDVYTQQLMRRRALTEWLKDTVKDRMEREISEGEGGKDSDICAVLSSLSGGCVWEACQRAQEAGDHRLSLMLAQAAGPSTPRHMLRTQMERWKENKVDEFLSCNRLKVYALLSGHMTWDSHLNSINVCENMDWKRCLAMHLWYKCLPTSCITEALAEYDQAYTDSNARPAYAAKPVPRYVENQDEWAAPEGLWDVCYHLLRLYCDKTHPMTPMLDPETVTPDRLDYRLSWQLLQVLSALQYRHVSAYQHAALCCSFAAQLEASGVWHWALFVLMHIPQHAQRESAVRELLLRHASLEEDDEQAQREIFVVQKLRVPAQWIHHAKAVKAKCEGALPEEACYLLQAQKWNDCHTAILQHVASDAIINENYDYLGGLLQQLGSSDNVAYIQGWDVGGKVYLDYIHMMLTLEQLKQGRPSVYELEKLQPEVTSLATRISMLKCNHAQDRLCQAEMAKRLAILTRTLASMYGTSPSARTLAPVVARLPLPEDYALQELRQLTRSHMQEVTGGLS